MCRKRGLKTEFCPAKVKKKRRKSQSSVVEYVILPSVKMKNFMAPHHF